MAIDQRTAAGGGSRRAPYAYYLPFPGSTVRALLDVTAAAPPAARPAVQESPQRRRGTVMAADIDRFGTPTSLVPEVEGTVWSGIRATGGLAYA